MSAETRIEPNYFVPKRQNRSWAENGPTTWPSQVWSSFFDLFLYFFPSFYHSRFPFRVVHSRCCPTAIVVRLFAVNNVMAHTRPIAMCAIRTRAYDVYQILSCNTVLRAAVTRRYNGCYGYRSLKKKKRGARAHV